MIVRLTMFALALVFSGHLLAAEYFLDEAERAMLVPNKDVEGVLHHRMEGVELGSYDNLLFGGGTMYFHVKSRYKEIDPEEIKAISDGMRSAMAEAAGGYSVVSEPGESTLLLNVAVTEIRLEKKKRGLLGYTPVGAVVTAAGDAAGLRKQLKSAKIEGELVDSQTGEKLAIFRVEDIPESKENQDWDGVTRVFRDMLSQGVVAVKPK